VDGQQGGDLPCPDAIPRFQPTRNASLELHAPRGPQLLVQRRLVQDMLESIAPPTDSHGWMSYLLKHGQRWNPVDGQAANQA